MSEFSRRVLEKYGWTEGKGLGKSEDGMTKPLKASLKFDTQGIGHDSAKDLTSRWWCDVFNEASECLKVENSEHGVHIVSRKKQKSVLPTSGNARKKFVKAEMLTNCLELADSKGKEMLLNVSLETSDSDSLYRKCEAKQCFLASSSMTGKLKRIQTQDEEFAVETLKKLKTEFSIPGPRKKKSKHIRTRNSNFKLENTGHNFKNSNKIKNSI